MQDLISRQAAIDTIMGQPPEPHYPSWYAAQIEKLPAVQPDHTADIGKKVEGDCISRQAAIEYLMTNMNWYDEDGYESDDDYKRECITELINGVPSAQPEQRWIPCSERLPEEGEDIIVTYVDDEETRIIPVNYDKGTWYDCIFDTALNPIKVIAWMPLPEPYREESEE